jgi:hypothetical protein
MILPIRSPTSSGIMNHPSSHARILRDFHVDAYSASLSAVATGIAPSEWLIMYRFFSSDGK